MQKGDNPYNTKSIFTEFRGMSSSVFHRIFWKPVKKLYNIASANSKAALLW